MLVFTALPGHEGGALIAHGSSLDSEPGEATDAALVIHALAELWREPSIQGAVPAAGAGRVSCSVGSSQSHQQPGAQAGGGDQSSDTQIADACDAAQLMPTLCVTQNEPVVFAYDAKGRMASYADTDADVEATYTYDASGQRLESTVTVDSTTTETGFVYEGLTLLRLAATQGATSWSIDYLYDEEDAPWGGVYRTQSATTYFSLITSDHGDVVCLCDADGAAFAAYRYDAWGQPQGEGTFATGIWTQATNLVTSTLAGEIASRQVLRYASYAFDGESGLYYCSARYYDPATRQWTTGDPAKADGEESAYQYWAGNPVEATDVSGRATATTRKVWTGASCGHPTWRVTLKTRIRYAEKEWGRHTYYRITEIGGRIENKQGKFYVLGHVQGKEAGVPIDPAHDRYVVYWPYNALFGGYKVIPPQRHMTVDTWYTLTPDWLGSAWHRPGANALDNITPVEYGKITYYMKKNTDGTTVGRKAVSADVPEFSVD